MQTKLTQHIDINNCLPELHRQGVADSYGSSIEYGRNTGELPRGTVEFSHDEFGKTVKRVYHSGRTGGSVPIAVKHARGRSLVGDITDGPWSTAEVPVEFGDLYPQPAALRLEGEKKHLVKMQRDANALMSHLPGEVADYEVSFHARYDHSKRKASRRLRVRKTARPPTTPSHPTDVEQGLERAHHAVGKQYLPKARLMRETGQDIERLAVHGRKLKALAIVANSRRATRWIGGGALTLVIPGSPRGVVVDGAG
jgi:hypothetical protein